MSKPRFQVETIWPSGEVTVHEPTGDGFMFPDKRYGNAWLLEGNECVLGFSIDNCDERDCAGRRTVLRIIS